MSEKQHIKNKNNKYNNNSNNPLTARCTEGVKKTNWYEQDISINPMLEGSHQ